MGFYYFDIQLDSSSKNSFILADRTYFSEGTHVCLIL